MRDNDLVGVIGSGATSTYAPLIVYEGNEAKVREESLVLIDDELRNKRYLGILRYLKRLEPFLNPWQRTSYVDEPALVDSGTYPHTTGYIYIVGTVDNKGNVESAKIPPNPGSKVYIVRSNSDVKLNLGPGLIIGEHKYSGIKIPINPEALRHHILVIGATGSGKSRLVVALIREVLSKTEWNVIVFDHSGLDYAPMFSKDNVVSASDFILDPVLIADNMVRNSYMGVSSDRTLNDYFTVATTIYMFCSALMGNSGGDREHTLRVSGTELKGVLSNRSRDLLHECSNVVSRCVVTKDVLDEITEALDINEVLRLSSRKTIEWSRSCFKKVLTSTAKLMGARRNTIIKLSIIVDLWLGDAFFRRLSSRNLLPSHILRRVRRDRLVIIDLSTENVNVRRYIVSALLKSLWDVADISKEPLNTLIVIDEAHNYACRSCKPSLDLIGRVAREGRKWGLGIVLVSQRAIDIDPDIRNNINTLLFSKLQTPSDYEQISSFMSLAGLKQEYLLMLERREFFLVGLGNPLKIPILLKVFEVGKNE